MSFHVGVECSSVVLRRAFLAASTLWLALIPLAAFAATRPSAPSSIYALAAGVYGVGHFVCHQLPARSFHLWGAQLPVCARCTGIYLGAAVAAVSLTITRRRHLAEVRSTKADPR